jgi:hypothetical protein
VVGDREVEREEMRVLAEGEEGDDLDMFDKELFQPQLEGGILEQYHDGALKKVVFPSSALCSSFLILSCFSGYLGIALIHY